ncbi:MAG: MlaE family lipid ABC transporter permease subunit [Planctomycetota bacterium]|jgi:phospholipid/cholesterol/gamma-HCH transport system permease protein
MVRTEYNTDGGNLRLVIEGRLDAETVSRVWPEALRKLSSSKPSIMEIDATGVEYCDGSGAALFLNLKNKQEKENRQLLIKGLKPEFEQLIKIFDPGEIAKPLPGKLSLKGSIERTGQIGWNISSDLKTEIAFGGEVIVKFVNAVLRPRSIRWTDTFVIAEKSGADAVGITCLLGFLIGLILAFQSAIAMQKFGAQIYVADLVVIVLFRELGALITAVIFAARSGSAFAAEIGTMKVNEEIDALTTMGLDPVKFLAVPRMLAGLFMMPLLTMFNLLFGLIGCGMVMASLGFPFVTFMNRIQQACSLSDFTGGMIKTFVFGMIIAVVGCLRGLQTKTGASAVGDSATKAVVTSIIAIVIVDGVFAVVYYFIGF